MDIPFNRPFFIGNELAYIQEAIKAGQISGDGLFTKRCQGFIEEKLSVGKVLLTTSCTHALEMMAFLLDIQPGDEVIVPSFTFVSTVNAFVLRGAVPVFADIRPDTLNMDEKLVEDLISPRTKAAVVVHYAGVGCEMDAILDISRRRGIPVLEDNAHGYLGTYRGKFLGTLGTFGALSFHETKNFICGEGGALIINDGRYIERAEIIREKGTNRSNFLKGAVDKYTWVDRGSSYLPSDILAAFLYAQLEKSDDISRRRLAIWNRYQEELDDLQEKGLLQLPHIPGHCKHPGHLFYVILKNEKTRADLIHHLRANGILAVFHYVPLHSSPMGQKLGCDTRPLPVTDDISSRLLRLPMYYEFGEDDQGRVIDSIKEFFVSIQ